MKKKVILRRLKKKLGKKGFAQYLLDFDASEVNLIQEIEREPEEVLIPKEIKKNWFTRLKEWLKI